MKPELDEARSAIFDLAGVIGASRDELPTFGHSEDMARPHVEKREGKLALVVVERGQEQHRRETEDLDELMYWVFEGVTFSMACEWELRHRVEDQDSRILLFTKQLELLERLSRRWAERYREEKRSLLRDVGIEPGEPEPR
ncbi:MAG TPA: Imm63 family immunity protein [Thermoleophilaceae bacterium]|jgi:hypothetical protein